MHRLFGTRELLSKYGAVALAVLIGTISGWILFVTADRLFFEYVYYPYAKAQDAYIYPEWRYRVFDLVLIAWCFDGLFAAALLVRSQALRQGLEGLARRTTVWFFAGLGVLAASVAIGTWLRSHGI